MAIQEENQQELLREQQLSRMARLAALKPEEEKGDENDYDNAAKEEAMADEQAEYEAMVSEQFDPTSRLRHKEDRVSEIKRAKLEQRKREEAEKKKKEEEKKKKGEEGETGDMAHMLDLTMTTSGLASLLWLNIKNAVSMWNLVFHRPAEAKSPLFPIINPLIWKTLNPSRPGSGPPLPNIILNIGVLIVDFFVILYYIIQLLIFILPIIAPYLLAAGGIGLAAYAVGQAF